MNKKEQLAAKIKRAQQLQGLATERDLTGDELTEIKSLADEINGLRTDIKAADDAKAMLSTLSEGDVAPLPEGSKSDDATQRGGLGDRFINSEGFKAFAKHSPAGVGSGTPVSIEGKGLGSMREVVRGRKADASLLTSPLGFVVPQRLDTVDLTVAPPLTLLDLITLGETTSSAIQYLQITSVTRGAKRVPEATSATDDAALKPKSALSTNLATAPVVTYADGIDVTNQLLSDAPALATFINGQLDYNVRNVIQDDLINGTGANGEPEGILHTTGVQEQAPIDEDGNTVAAGSGDMFKGVRRAITRIRRTGGVATGVLLSPEDDEEWDTKRNLQGNFYSGGPFAQGPGTAWGRPRASCEALEQGQYIVADFKTIALLQREAMSVLAFNQHKDYAQRNLVYVRGELRGAQVIFKPAHIVVGEL